jgi:hypothetical protein
MTCIISRSLALTFQFLPFSLLQGLSKCHLGMRSLICPKIQLNGAVSFVRIGAGAFSTSVVRPSIIVLGADATMHADIGEITGGAPVTGWLETRR